VVFSIAFNHGSLAESAFGPIAVHAAAPGGPERVSRSVKHFDFWSSWLAATRDWLALNPQAISVAALK
jgi:hypothetical protein